MRPSWGLYGILLALLASPAGAGAPDFAASEAILRGARVPTEGQGLLDFFRNREAASEAAEKKIEALIEKLGSGRFREREKAMADLMALGVSAKPCLLRAADHKDVEVRKRVAECLSAVTSKTSLDVELAALHVLRVKWPDDATKALLLYLPSIREEIIEGEVLTTLLAVGILGGKADEDLEAALKDKLICRRAAAALVIGQAGSAAQKEEVRKLLDPHTEPLLRLRAAQGLAAGKDVTAIPALLDLLVDAPLPLAEQARDFLATVAGDRAPTADLADNAEARKKCRQEWAAWWKANEKTFDRVKVYVGQPWLTHNARAQKVAMQYLRAIQTHDREGLMKTTDEPFGRYQKESMEKSEQLAARFGRAPRHANPLKIESLTLRVIDVKQYLAGVPSDRAMGFLNDLRASEVRIVYIGKEKGTDKVETRVIFVRIRAGQARIIGSRPIVNPPLRKKK